MADIFNSYEQSLLNSEQSVIESYLATEEEASVEMRDQNVGGSALAAMSIIDESTCVQHRKKPASVTVPNSFHRNSKITP